MSQSNDYFRTHQKELLLIANTTVGRDMLSTPADQEFTNSKIVKVSSNSIHELIGFDGLQPIIRAYFYADDRIDRILLPIFTKVEIAKDYVTDRKEALLHYAGIDYRWDKYPQILLVTSTFTPTTGEGEIKGPTNAATWALERSGSGVAQTTPIIVFGATSAGTFNLNRVFEVFDTSTIGSGQTIQSSFIKMYRDDTIDAFHNLDTTTYELVKSQQVSATALANGDYQNFTNTSIGSTALSATTNAAYTNTTNTDQTAIAPTSFTKLAIILGLDLSNTSPTGSNECCFQNRANANPPTLSVTYIANTTGHAIPLTGAGIA